MTRLQEFETLTDTEDFFDFFDVEYDEKLVYVKRFHIMKKYGEMLLKAKEQNFASDEIKLNFYKFALISVYKNFENGYAPSAADIWSMFDNPSACGSCSTATSCNSVEEVSSGVHACTSQSSLSFH
ncbi:MAG: nitrogenase-stabilizing/protective protein NifW [Sulfurimonas sp.]|jgi:nitrogenase-stabilizing/protective protein